LSNHSKRSKRCTNAGTRAPFIREHTRSQDDGIKKEQLTQVLPIIWAWAIVQLERQIKLAKLPRTILSAEQVIDED